MPILKRNKEYVPKQPLSHRESVFRDPVDPQVCSDVPVLIDHCEEDLSKEFVRKIGITNGMMNQVDTTWIQYRGNLRVYKGKISFPGYRRPIIFKNVIFRILDV